VSVVASLVFLASLASFVFLLCSVVLVVVAGSFLALAALGLTGRPCFVFSFCGGSLFFFFESAKFY
jgi:hypothetical protein